MIRRPPRSPLFPSTPLSRSAGDAEAGECCHDPVERPRRQDADGADHEQDDERAEEAGAAGDPAGRVGEPAIGVLEEVAAGADADRKSTRLNSSHSQISYAVF